LVSVSLAINGETHWHDPYAIFFDYLLWQTTYAVGYDTYLGYCQPPSSRLYHSAVNADNLCRDIAGPLAGKEGDQLSHIIRSAEVL